MKLKLLKHYYLKSLETQTDGLDTMINQGPLAYCGESRKERTKLGSPLRVVTPLAPLIYLDTLSDQRTSGFGWTNSAKAKSIITGTTANEFNGSPILSAGLFLLYRHPTSLDFGGTGTFQEQFDGFFQIGGC